MNLYHTAVNHFFSIFEFFQIKALYKYLSLQYLFRIFFFMDVIVPTTYGFIKIDNININPEIFHLIRVPESTEHWSLISLHRS